jgi:DNA-binding MarR family transcriptional regulator
MRANYLETIQFIERLHRQFLEVLKNELERAKIGDINNIQALILFNIGQDEMTVGDLIERGYYLGSNVSYNVKKMVENGYLGQERSLHDRRSIMIRLTEKGLGLCARLNGMFDRHAALLAKSKLSVEEFKQLTAIMRKMEGFWTQPSRVLLAGAPPPVSPQPADSTPAAAVGASGAIFF